MFRAEEEKTVCVASGNDVERKERKFGEDVSKVFTGREESARRADCSKS